MEIGYPSVGRCRSGDHNEAKPVGEGERTKGAPEHLPALAMRSFHFPIPVVVVVDVLFCC